MSGAPLVRVSGLRRTFAVSTPWLGRLLRTTPRLSLLAAADISFAIPRGKTFALVGESGSGKTTVARMVVGLLPPHAGEVRIDNIPITDPAYADDTRRLRRTIHMVFQDPYASLNPRWRVERIVAEPIRVFGLASSSEEISRRVSERLELVGLHPADRRKFPHQFSGGQRQRIAIARGLASEANFIVCDEPTSALDVSVQAQILNLMRDLQRRFDLTYLFISHDLAVVRHMADQIGVMYLGRIVEIGSSQALFDAPRHPYTRMLLAAVPRIANRDRAQAEISGEIPNPINPPSGCAFHPRCPIAFERCRREPPALLDGVACHAVEQGGMLSA